MIFGNSCGRKIEIPQQLLGFDNIIASLKIFQIFQSFQIFRFFQVLFDVYAVSFCSRQLSFAISVDRGENIVNFRGEFLNFLKYTISKMFSFALKNV